MTPDTAPDYETLLHQLQDAYTSLQRDAQSYRESWAGATAEIVRLRQRVTKLEIELAEARK